MHLFGKGMAAALIAAGGARAQQFELSRLITHDNQSGDRFGGSMATVGDIALISAVGDNDNGSDSGSVYVFDISNPNAPVELTKFTPEESDTDHHFGSAIAIDGHLAIIGASGDDEFDDATGAAYLYDISDPEKPIKLSRLLPPGGQKDDLFGCAVAIEGDLVLIGAYEDWFDNNTPRSDGEAYIFDISNPKSPVLLVKIEPEGLGESFGWSVALRGNLAIIGDPDDDDRGFHAGAVHFYDISDPMFPEFLAQVYAYNADELMQFGSSIDIEGDLAIIGAIGAMHEGVRTGAAYLYDLSDPAAPLGLGQLYPTNGHWGQGFGASVALKGNAAIVGSALVDGQARGTASIFDIGDPKAPVELAELKPSESEPIDYFGASVAFGTHTALVGAPWFRINNFGRGAAFVYPACPADLNADGQLDVLDFVTFQLLWQDQAPAGDCDASGAFNVLDFVCYQLLWQAGCPDS